MSRSDRLFSDIRLEELEPVVQMIIFRERMSRIEEFKELMKDKLKNYDVLFRWVIGLMLAGFLALGTLIITLSQQGK